jgi:hypothetical protein
MRQLQDDIVARRRASRMEPEPFNEEDECNFLSFYHFTISPFYNFTFESISRECVDRKYGVLIIYL